MVDFINVGVTHINCIELIYIVTER